MLRNASVLIVWYTPLDRVFSSRSLTGLYNKEGRQVFKIWNERPNDFKVPLGQIANHLPRLGNFPSWCSCWFHDYNWVIINGWQECHVHRKTHFLASLTSANTLASVRAKVAPRSPGCRRNSLATCMSSNCYFCFQKLGITNQISEFCHMIIVKPNHWNITVTCTHFIAIAY